MGKEVWVTAVGFDGESLAGSRVDRDEVMAYASDTDMELLDERGYTISFCPRLLTDRVDLASKIGIRPFPGGGAICVSGSLTAFSKEVSQLPAGIAILTSGRPVAALFPGRDLGRIIREEKAEFDDWTGGLKCGGGIMSI